MDRNRFNAEVRPAALTEILIGEQGIALDRFELDAWVDDYIIAARAQDALEGSSTMAR